MKLTIKNLWKFNAYATNFFRNHDKQPTESYEVGGNYFFKFRFQDIEWKIELGRKKDFMPGWPVSVWAYNYDIGATCKLSETNVRHDVLNDKNKWCQFLDDLITSNYIHHRNLLTR